MPTVSKIKSHANWRFHDVDQVEKYISTLIKMNDHIYSRDNENRHDDIVLNNQNYYQNVILRQNQNDILRQNQNCVQVVVITNHETMYTKNVKSTAKPRKSSNMLECHSTTEAKAM